MLSLILMPAARRPLAATLTATVSASGVSASVHASCGVAAKPLAFGSYAGARVVARTTITVTCTEMTPYAVGLDAGSSSGATVTTRHMTGPGGAKLAYGLFQNEARTVIWGDSLGVDTSRGVGSGAAQMLTVYAVEAAGQAPLPGHYADTITIIMTY